MTSYTLPNAPSRAEWTPIKNERRFTSESGIAKFQGRNGSRWGLTLQWMNLTGTKRQDLDGVLAGLNDPNNRLQVLPQTIGYKRRGVGGGAPVLLNASFSAGAAGITADGAMAGVTNWLRKGDWINLANELHKVQGDVNSNGSGVVVIEIWPPLFKNQADNTPLVISQAGVYGMFFLVAPVSMPAVPYNSTDFIADSITLTLEQDVTA